LLRDDLSAGQIRDIVSRKQEDDMLTQQINDRAYFFAGQFLLTLDRARKTVKARVIGQPQTEVWSIEHYQAACAIIAMPVSVREKAVADFANWACFAEHGKPNPVRA
jgi:hypothetical protein